MKLRWKIAIGMMVLGIGFAAFVALIDGAGKRAVAEARQSLRQQGFKTDLSEFDFSTSPELRQREHALTNASLDRLVGSPEQQARRSILQQEEPPLMQMITADAALAAWQRARLPNSEGADLWPAFRELFAADQQALDAAAAAALSGPIRFELDASQGLALLLRHLAPVKSLARTFGQRAVLKLHDGDVPAAWTNLLAATRLVTAWEVEATEISYLVQFACAHIVFNTTWEMLQTNAWSEAQLRQLQREWEAVDYFKGLPDTVAFTRASSVAACELQRREPILGGMKFGEILRYPRSAWNEVQGYWHRRDYRWRGVFVDEKALFLHFRDREVEVREAIKCSNWLEMRSLPGVTNKIPFQSTQQSRVASMLNLRQIGTSYQGLGSGILARAAETESLRRLLITALALERHHRGHGAYPNSLSELVPQFLKAVPIDFADGRTLRYRLSDDGRYLMWSVGLDGVDQGGKIALRKAPSSGEFSSEDRQPRRQKPADLVWPRLASAAEVMEFHHQQVQEQKVALERSEEWAAEGRWNRTADRQAQVERILKGTAPRNQMVPKVQGRELQELLLNRNAVGTNRFTLDEMLTLKPIMTGAEPETATFEVPMAYDVLTNVGSLHLYIDPLADDLSSYAEEGCNVAWLQCLRATNGNCLLVWETIYEAPGKHALQLGLWLENNPEADICGPLVPFVVSNFCQFSVESAVFNPEIGATLRAKLPEDNASYSVDIKSPEGQRLHTATGNTTNGVIKIFWNLMDDRGVRMTNESFGTVFHVTLTDSGRTQTMRGP